MKGHSADRRWGFSLADHGLAMGGLALLAVGAATSWWAMSLAGQHWRSPFSPGGRGGGLRRAPPRAGAIRTGGGDIPFAFKVRRGSGCSSSSARRTPSEEAGRRVHRARPAERHRRLRALLLPPHRHPSGWSLRGRVPVDDLRFEHHERVLYVTRDRSSARCPRPGCEPTVSQDASRIGKLILVPAVITLAVTLLRLVGELQGWSLLCSTGATSRLSPSLVGIWLLVRCSAPGSDGS